MKNQEEQCDIGNQTHDNTDQVGDKSKIIDQLLYRVDEIVDEARKGHCSS